jgi:hypothetical protein
MEKYLFVDGANVIREVESGDELQSLIKSSAEPAKARIWVFNSCEWITALEFSKRSPGPIAVTNNTAADPSASQRAIRRPFLPGLLKKGLIGLATATTIFLIYNFTRLNWTKTSPLTISADRPANSPFVNVDSVVELLEFARGQKLDKITRTNLRIRNSWPDLIQLQLTASRDTSREGLRFHDLTVKLDNSTGYMLDNAVVKLQVWKNHEVNSIDTIHFTNIGYALPAERRLETVYKGDSVSLSFVYIRARSFNFCYSADKKNTYGSYNDRWYCKE